MHSVSPRFTAVYCIRTSHELDVCHPCGSGHHGRGWLVDHRKSSAVQPLWARGCGIHPRRLVRGWDDGRGARGARGGWVSLGPLIMDPSQCHHTGSAATVANCSFNAPIRYNPCAKTWGWAPWWFEGSKARLLLGTRPHINKITPCYTLLFKSISIRQPTKGKVSGKLYISPFVSS